MAKPITIRVAETPIVGTLMHKRWEGREWRDSRGYEIGPEYRGSDIEGAKRDADFLALTGFVFGGQTYTKVEGQWYKLVLT